MEIPELLIKVVSKETWEKSKRDGALLFEALDIKDNYIHMATKEQLEKVIMKFWKGKKYILLYLDPCMLVGTLKLERNPGGESQYYHLYDGHIPPSAIKEVVYP